VRVKGRRGKMKRAAKSVVEERQVAAGGESRGRNSLLGMSVVEVTATAAAVAHLKVTGAAAVEAARAAVTVGEMAVTAMARHKGKVVRASGQSQQGQQLGGQPGGVAGLAALLLLLLVVVLVVLLLLLQQQKKQLVVGVGRVCV
jgi:hypothetical protein